MLQRNKWLSGVLGVVLCAVAGAATAQEQFVPLLSYRVGAYAARPPRRSRACPPLFRRRQETQRRRVGELVGQKLLREIERATSDDVAVDVPADALGHFDAFCVALGFGGGAGLHGSSPRWRVNGQGEGRIAEAAGGRGAARPGVRIRRNAVRVIGRLHHRSPVSRAVASPVGCSDSRRVP
jgi:hypothetical protein